MISDVLFSPAEIALFERELGHVDGELQALADELGFTYFSSGGRGRPGRRLRRRFGFRIYVLELILNPDYLQDERRHYELREQWMYAFGALFTRLLSHRLVSTFDPLEMSSAAAIVDAARTHLRVAVTTARGGSS
jgi:hypothetical protein